VKGIEAELAGNRLGDLSSRVLKQEERMSFELDKVSKAMTKYCTAAELLPIANRVRS